MSIKRNVFWILMGSIMPMWATFGSPAALADQHVLILGVPAAKTAVDALELPPGFPPASRFRPIALNPMLQAASMTKKGDEVVLNLFDDAQYRAVVDEVSVNVNGTVTVRGRIEKYFFGYFLISTTGERSLGEIRIPEKGKQYAVQSRPDHLHYVIDIDETKLERLEDAPCLIPPPITPEEEAERLKSAPKEGPPDPANIDVMVVCTPAAETWAQDSGGGIENVVAQAMGKAQLTLQNSNTLLTMTLVHYSSVGYTESGNSSTDLYRLTDTSDGFMDIVHTWRDQYAADLVTLFAMTDGGIAWQLGSTFGRPDHGFSITQVQSAALSNMHIHEMGHNMGCHHHKDQNVQPGPGLSSYSAGWRWIGNDSNRYCSVMTYASGSYFSDGLTHTSVANFSNPSIPYQGVATGHAVDGDNARTIRETMHAVAAYRFGGEPPIPIASIGELQKIGNEAGYPLGGSYILTQDIDASATAGWNGGRGFDPIGTGVYYDPFIAFWGAFDGQGHVITGLTINRADENYVGLFGATAGRATIRNVGMENNSVTGGSTTGGLVGSNGGAVSACHATGAVTGGDYTGGLVGYNYGDVSACHATGAVMGLANVAIGGLVGYNSGDVSACHTTSAVTGESYIGGLVGENGGAVSACYATGAVTGSDYYIGGLLGYNDGAVATCYWNIETTGRATSAGGEGRTTAEMTHPYAANTYVDWDFAAVWTADTNYSLNNGYPYLRENLPSPVTLSVTPASQSVVAPGAAKTFTITTTATWTAASSAGWATVSPASGTGNGTLTVTCAANTGAARSATITVTGAGTNPGSVTVTVNQAAAPTLSVTPASQSVVPQGVATTFTITTTAAWTAASSAGWATVSPASGTGNGTLTVTCAANTGAARSATITVTGTGTNPGSVQVTVVQNEVEPVEGEGEILPEGEGEILPEGEGEVLQEGEGEVLQEGEGEVLQEGEGEVLPEGEGEAPVEGEVAAEGEGEPSQPPSKVTDPDPWNGESSVSINTGLSWSSSLLAGSYNVYFGTDSPPDNGEFKVNQVGTGYNPGTLAYGTTYYWRIDAKNTAGTTTGNVWHFTTESAPLVEGEVPEEGEGEDEVIVPEVFGSTLTEARSVLVAVGLKYSVAFACNDEVPVGSVIHQTPAAHEDIAAGSTVYLTVSNGPCEASPCGCCQGGEKSLSLPELLKRTLGDWLIVGLSICVLLALAMVQKRT